MKGWIAMAPASPVTRLLTLVTLVSLCLGLFPPRAFAATSPSLPPPTARIAPAATTEGVQAVTRDAQTAPTTPAAEQGPRKELVALRTRTSRTYVSRHGHETQVFPGPIHYQDATGAWQPIDNTLVPAPGPAGGYQNSANDHTVHLPSDLGNAPVQVTQGSAAVGFSLVGAHGGATIAGPTATYANVLPGVTVAYSVGNDEVKEAITLQNAAAPASFVFTLQTGAGLTARATATGGVEIVGSAGQVLGSFVHPFMQDASGSPTGRSQAVSLTLGSGATGPTLTLTPDPTWLAHPARPYPVVIDPTYVVKNPTQNCSISGGSNANTNLCGNTELEVGTLSSVPYRSLLQFDASLPLGTANVVDAYLTLDATYSQSKYTIPVEAHQLTRAWTTGTTWNTTNGTTAWTTAGGDYTSAATWTTNVGPTLGTYRWYLTNLVQGWVNGTIPNTGILLRDTNEASGYHLDFASTRDTNAAHWPSLTIYYEPWQGELGFYTMERHGLTDRMHTAVHVANGNLVLHETDLAVAGTGLPLVIGRTYNELSARAYDLGWNWVMDTGYDVWLDTTVGDGVTFFGPGGFAVHYTKNADGSYTTPAGIDATLVKNGDGSYTLTAQQSGGKDTFASNGWLTATTDKNGNRLSFAYNNANSSLTAITDSQGRVTTFSYSSAVSAYFITTMTDPAGRTYQYAYDSGSRLISYTDPAGGITRYDHDPQNSLTQLTDPNGLITQFTYDSTYRVTSITSGAGTAVAATWHYTYNAGNTVSTDPNGHATTYVYDAYGRVTQVTDAAGNAFQTAWTADNHVQSATDARG